MKLGKKAPRGNPAKLNGHRWPKGVSGNPGGRPFIKVHQRLAKICANELSVVAAPEIASTLGLAEGASWGQCVVKSMILRAAIDGDVGASHFLHSCTEAANIRSEEPHDVAFRVVWDDPAGPAVRKLFEDDFIPPEKAIDEGKG